MIVVNGVNGSGFESVLSAFGKRLGDKGTAGHIYRGRQFLKDHGDRPVSDYEKYLDKFNKAKEQDVTADVDELTKDGVWPVYNINSALIRPVIGSDIKADVAVRLGGSLFELNDNEVDKIYIVLTAPRTVWLRRQSMKMQFRKLDLKYGEDLTFKAVMQTQFRGWSPTPKAMEEELMLFKDYVNNCLFKFKDKVYFIDGDGDTLTFDKDGTEVTVPNKNVHRHAMSGKIPEDKLGRPFEVPEFDRVRQIWEEIKLLAVNRTPAPMISKYTTPNVWFCSRTHKMINVGTCLRCIASQGDYVIEDAKPGWDMEPCAYEVAYGPEPHKTVEESIKDHSWGVLP